MATAVDTQDQRIVAALSHLSAGRISVVQVDVEPRDEPDRSYLLVQLRLSRPLGEEWDADDFYSIRREARTAVIDVVQPGSEFELSYVTDDASDGDDVDSLMTDELIGPADASSSGD